MNYYKLYIKSISEGLNNSIYYINHKEIEPELFYQSIKNALSSLRNHKGRIYFWEMVQVLLLQIIWH